MGEVCFVDTETLGLDADRLWWHRVLSAPRAGEPDAMADYGECARAVGGEVLRWALANPERYARTPAETEITWPELPDGKKDYNNPIYGRQGLYDVLKADGIPLEELGITGFQWGWAYNAARRCLELPPEPNPAIITIGGSCGGRLSRD